MKPKAEIFFDAITLLPESIVEEAQDYHFRKKQSSWKKFGALAACMALIASLSLLLPMRGCGGSAPGDMNSSGSGMVSTDSCAPADGDAAASGDTMPEPSTPEPSEAPAAPEGGYGQTMTAQFTAVVIELDDVSILVEPLEGEDLRNSYDKIVVFTRDLERPVLSIGDTVRITYDGEILESDPAAITGAAAIEQIDRE